MIAILQKLFHNIRRNFQLTVFISLFRNKFCFQSYLVLKACILTFSFDQFCTSWDFKNHNKSNHCGILGSNYLHFIWQLNQDSLSKKLLCKISHFLERGLLFFSLEIRHLKNGPRNPSFKNSVTISLHHSSNCTISSPKSYFI